MREKGRPGLAVTPVILAPGRPGQEDRHELKASLRHNTFRAQGYFLDFLEGTLERNFLTQLLLGTVEVFGSAAVRWGTSGLHGKETQGGEVVIAPKAVA